MPRSIDDALELIRDRAGMIDRTGAWPADELDALADAGVMRWAVPRAHGGEGVNPLDLHLRYERLAAASVTVALVLTQRDSAISFIDGGDNQTLTDELLPRLARYDIFATVGIAQLTTSRQTGPPAVRATRRDGAWRLNGTVPWSTGADKADVIIVGAVTEDRRQVLIALPRETTGVDVRPPLPLVALSGSWTQSVELRDVVVDERWVVRGPAQHALAGRRAGVPVGQAFLALGLCRAGLNLIGAHRSERAAEAHQRLCAQLASARSEVLTLCDPATAPADPGAHAPRMRGGVNDLALRITHAAVTLYKGTALLTEHPAQRLAREALFLLVWSCPDPVIDCTVELLSDDR